MGSISLFNGHHPNTYRAFDSSGRSFHIKMSDSGAYLVSELFPTGLVVRPYKAFVVSQPILNLLSKDPSPSEFHAEIRKLGIDVMNLDMKPLSDSSSLYSNTLEGAIEIIQYHLDEDLWILAPDEPQDKVEDQFKPIDISHYGRMISSYLGISDPSVIQRLEGFISDPSNVKWESLRPCSVDNGRASFGSVWDEVSSGICVKDQAPSSGRELARACASYTYGRESSDLKPN